MATQTQERSRLSQKVIRHGSVGVVANSAVLRNGRVLIDKRSLLVRMALVADHVYGRFLQVSRGAAVGIVAAGAHHLPFLQRMVRGEGELGGNILVAGITHFRVLHRHGQTMRPIESGMPDVRDAGELGARMWIVAIHAGYAVQGVGGRFKTHGGMALVALQAQVHPRFRLDIAVGIMARFAFEAIGAENLMRMGDTLELLGLFMATIAGLRPARPQGLGGGPDGLHVHRVFLGFLMGSHPDLVRPAVEFRNLGGRSSGRHVIMRLVALGA